MVTRSFLKTIETHGQDQERYSWKKKFILGLYESGLTRDVIFSLYQFIDLIMNLSAELEKELNDEIENYEGGKKWRL